MILDLLSFDFARQIVQKNLVLNISPMAPRSGLFGCTFDPTTNSLCQFGRPGTPNWIVKIEVYMDTHQKLATTRGFTSQQIENEIKRTTGHEVGHGLHICHRTVPSTPCPDGASVGTVDSIMSSNITGTPQNDPASQYNSADAQQIRIARNP